MKIWKRNMFFICHFLKKCHFLQKKHKKVQKDDISFEISLGKKWFLANFLLSQCLQNLSFGA